jgi:DNA replication protein
LRLRQQLGKLDLLILDELGYVPASKAGAELLFDVIATAYERNSLIVTTNLPFENWGRSRQRTLDRGSLGPADPPLPHPGNKGRKLPTPGC